MSVLLGSAHWDWSKRPTGCWDRRPAGLAHPRATFPPVQCMVVNAVGERLENVVAVDFDNDLVLMCVPELVDGVRKYRLSAETGLPLADWVPVPGVNVRPLPAALLRAEEAKALARKGYRREADGTISTGHAKE